MGEAQRAGVQCLARAQGKAVLDVLLVFLRAEAFEYLGSAVFVVAEEGMAYMLHVYANLVRSSGLEAAFNECDIREALEYAPMGNGFFCLGTVLEVPYAVEGAVLVVACESSFDGAAVLPESAPDEGVVGAFGRMVEELPCQMGLRFRRLGDEQQTRGVLVDTVDEADGRVVYVNFLIFAFSHFRILLEVPGEGMEEGVFVVAVTGMNDQTGRLVDHEQVVVLIDDVERYVLRRDGVVMRFVVEQHLNDITGFDAVVGGHGLAVDPHITRIRGRLDTVAARVGHVHREVFVNALLALALVHLASPAFP